MQGRREEKRERREEVGVGRGKESSFL